MSARVDGGAPTPVAPAPNGRGGSWGPDETIVFAANVEEGLWRVAAAGGPPARVTTLGPKELLSFAACAVGCVTPQASDVGRNKDIGLRSEAELWSKGILVLRRSGCSRSERRRILAFHNHDRQSAVLIEAPGRRTTSEVVDPALSAGRGVRT